MRMLVGFILGLMVASAMAQTIDISRTPTLAAGTNPDHQPAPIQVDKDGYVICSTEHKPIYPK